MARQEKARGGAWAWSIAHGAHAGSYLVLLGTGILLFAPALRASVTGGYSLTVSAAHGAAGWFFLTVTLPLAGRWFRGPRLGTSRSLHLAFVVGAALAFAATGVAMGSREDLPLGVVDAARDLHRWLAWASGGVVSVHLPAVVARRMRRRRIPEGAPGGSRN
jgi:hypothetical protein